MADNFLSGRTGDVTINGTEVAMTQWEINPNTEIVRFRNSRTNKFSRKEPTFHEASGTITIDFDNDAPWGAAPLSLVQGAKVTNLKLIVTGGTGGTNFWLFPSAIITGTPQSVVIDGKEQTRINFENDGTFSVPGGATPA